MADTATMKQGDTGPPLTATLYNPDGTVANLTGATVKLNVRPTRGGTLLIDHGPVAIIDVNGRASYTWQVPDTLNAGVFSVEWEVTYASGVKTTYPNDHSALLEIVRQTA